MLAAHDLRDRLLDPEAVLEREHQRVGAHQGRQQFGKRFVGRGKHRERTGAV